MQAAEPAPISTENALPFRSDKVDTPQQYANWRDYAFSDAPHEEPTARS